MLSIRKSFIYTLFLKMLGRSSNKQKIQFIITLCILGVIKGLLLRPLFSLFLYPICIFST